MTSPKKSPDAVALNEPAVTREHRLAAWNAVLPGLPPTWWVETGKGEFGAETTYGSIVQRVALAFATSAAELEQLRKLEAALLALPANCVLNYCGDIPAFLESAAELAEATPLEGPSGV